MFGNNKLFLLSTFTKSCKLKNDTVFIRLPITKGLLELLLFQVQKKYRKQPYLTKLYQALFAISYHGLLRIGETTHSKHTLRVGDVHSSTNTHQVLLVLRSSKTHTVADRPQKIHIEAEHSGTFCPVDLVLKFANARPKYKSKLKTSHILRQESCSSYAC